MTDELPDIDEDTVSIEQVGDYNVELDIDGLPSGSVAIDYFEGEDNPRIIIRAKEAETKIVSRDPPETVWATEIIEEHPFTDDTEEDDG